MYEVMMIMVHRVVFSFLSKILDISPSICRFVGSFLRLCVWFLFVLGACVIIVSMEGNELTVQGLLWWFFIYRTITVLIIIVLLESARKTIFFTVFSSIKAILCYYGFYWRKYGIFSLLIRINSAFPDCSSYRLSYPHWEFDLLKLLDSRWHPWVRIESTVLQNK